MSKRAYETVVAAVCVAVLVGCGLLSSAAKDPCTALREAKAAETKAKAVTRDACKVYLDAEKLDPKLADAKLDDFCALVALVP